MIIILETLLKLFDRDLQRLEEEINLYPSEEAIWKVSGDIKNPAGNLCLHICGNLQHYIGANLGRTSYVRNRDYEFAAKDISKAALSAEVQKTKQVVRETLETLKPSSLEAEYPEKVFEYSMTTAYFLIHLSSHLGYHLGQINYHRRILQ
ncbi:DinB family protein [Chryseolinea sp. H1M3-3]|uniref:DinB family protein n=1 Tax=Chryseolinea sp. H1M3-3 TaxID=3034144 RepID=UPI0032087F89